MFVTHKTTPNQVSLLYVPSQQTFVSLQDVLKTSSRHVLKTSSTRLQCNNFTSSKTSWRRLEDVFKTSRKTSWRRLGRRKIVTLKTSWRRLEDMSWRRLEDMSWRRLGDKQNVYWGCLYVTNLNVYLTNQYFTNLYLTKGKPKMHSLEPNNFEIETQAVFLF